MRVDQKSLNNWFILSSDFWSLSLLTLLTLLLGLLSLWAHLTFLASHSSHASLTLLSLALHGWVHSFFSGLLLLRFGLFAAHFCKLEKLWLVWANFRIWREFWRYPSEFWYENEDSRIGKKWEDSFLSLKWLERVKIRKDSAYSVSISQLHTFGTIFRW